VRGTYELRGISLGIVAGELSAHVDKVEEIARREVLLLHTVERLK
jgi:hypothetical protein